MERSENSPDVAVEPAERERLQAEIRREHDLYLRAMADFENFRKRVERENSKTEANAKRDILLSLLEVVDGFDRAMPHIAAAPAAVTEGIEALHRRLLELLEAQHVWPIAAVGEPFDPALHEALGSEESGKYPAGTVAEELQRGYRLGDELLRPARVRVAR
jgi:molecular chaperone GrpE